MEDYVSERNRPKSACGVIPSLKLQENILEKVAGTNQ